MSSVRVATTHGQLVGRLRANQLGLWFFIASESFLFAAVISARYYVLGVERPEELNQPLGFAISVVLLLSSLTAYRAEIAMGHDDRRRFFRNVRTTIGLGLLFLVGVGLEWQEGLRFFPPRTLYGSVFFTLVGLHAFHVFTGLVGLAVVTDMARRGRFGSQDLWPVEGVVKYWHFVDVAWVFIFPTLYLVS
ncbi:MAG TPA: cytochrome c oxidase subunit 3 [Actinomycetota bacterium]|nr:cytochrome c oxidase subunit 3 [Actinomycetota bacterium]